MATVVFLRGVNVGGHKTFRPSALARALADLRVVSVGAAGTFVVRASAPVARVRAAFLERLPVATELMVCAARDVARIAEDDPPGGEPGDAFVSVLGGRPRTVPGLPLRAPAGRDWEVEVAAVRGRFALSRVRRRGRARLYPNEVVERHLGVAATTRGWPTLLRIRAALR